MLLLIWEMLCVQLQVEGWNLSRLHKGVCFFLELLTYSSVTSFGTQTLGKKKKLLPRPFTWSTNTVKHHK